MRYARVCFGQRLFRHPSNDATALHLHSGAMPEVVFTLVTRSRVFDIGVKKKSIGPNGGFFDVSPENDRASPSVKPP